jgi:hypothetical protein
LPVISNLKENVEEFLGDKSVEAALGALNELYSKYKFMESSFEKSKGVYKVREVEKPVPLSVIIVCRASFPTWSKRRLY